MYKVYMKKTTKLNQAPQGQKLFMQLCYIPYSCCDVYYYEHKDRLMEVAQSSFTHSDNQNVTVNILCG